MSEELEQVQETQVEQTPVVDAKTATENRAREQGWVPEQEWIEAGHDASEWRSAREFLDRGELFSVIHTTKRELNQTRQQLQTLQQHNQKVYEAGYKKAIADLKSARREAIQDQDFARVDQIDEQIEQTKETFEKAKEEQKPAPQPVPEFQEFLARNTWFSNPKDGLEVRMQRFAVKAGEDFVALNPTAPPGAILAFMEKEVRETFDHKFKPQRRVNPVEGGGKEPSKGGNSKLSQIESSLNEHERRVMNNFVKNGVMTKEKYLEDLAKIREQ